MHNIIPQLITKKILTLFNFSMSYFLSLLYYFACYYPSDTDLFAFLHLDDEKDMSGRILFFLFTDEMKTLGILFMYPIGLLIYMVVKINGWVSFGKQKRFQLIDQIIYGILFSLYKNIDDFLRCVVY